MEPKDFVNITWQDGVVPEVGVNGCQINDVLEVVISRLAELNTAFPCEENDYTMDYIREAIMWQNRRTANRIAQGVEGQHVTHES